PPLGAQEAIEVTRIRALAGLGERLVRERPFRAPHHSISTAGLVGGAQRSWVGEVALAHHGVLFLDELSEFARPALEALRQPLEEGRLAIVRARGAAVYPARFMLVAATNPCPCGYAGDGERCDCGEAELARHPRRPRRRGPGDAPRGGTARQPRRVMAGPRPLSAQARSGATRANPRTACWRCMRRSWLIAELSPQLDYVYADRAHLLGLLGLGD